MGKWWKHTSPPSLFYLQRQADKFILLRAAVFLFLKGWLTTKEAGGGEQPFGVQCVIWQGQIVFGCSGKDFLMKLHFKPAAYAWFSLLLLILPFVNFCYCCSPGLRNFHTSCRVRPALTQLGVNYRLGCRNLHLPLQPFYSSQIFFFHWTRFTGEPVDWRTREEKWINSASMSVPSPRPENGVSQLHTVLGSQPSTGSWETVKLEIRVKIFPWTP